MRWSRLNDPERIHLNEPMDSPGGTRRTDISCDQCANHHVHLNTAARRNVLENRNGLANSCVNLFRVRFWKIGRSIHVATVLSVAALKENRRQAVRTTTVRELP